MKNLIKVVIGIVILSGVITTALLVFSPFSPFNRSSCCATPPPDDPCEHISDLKEAVKCCNDYSGSQEGFTLTEIKFDSFWTFIFFIHQSAKSTYF